MWAGDVTEGCGVSERTTACEDDGRDRKVPS
jgi:hypothetical protein